MFIYSVLLEYQGFLIKSHIFSQLNVLVKRRKGLCRPSFARLNKDDELF
jgi:hypothetical protein